MKKQILLLSLFVSASVMAQDGFKKGSIYGGLELYFGKSTIKSESSTGGVVKKEEPLYTSNWGIIPEANYFVADNLSLGLRLGFAGSMNTINTTSSNYTSVGTIKYKGPVLGLSARKYWNCSDKLLAYAGVGVDYNKTKGNDETVKTEMDGSSKTVTTTTTHDEIKTLTVGCNAGLAYHITPNILFFGSFGICSIRSTSMKLGKSGEDYDLMKSKDFNFDISGGRIPLSFGVMILLNGHHTGKKG